MIMEGGSQGRTYIEARSPHTAGLYDYSPIMYTPIAYKRMATPLSATPRKIVATPSHASPTLTYATTTRPRLSPTFLMHTPQSMPRTISKTHQPISISKEIISDPTSPELVGGTPLTPPPTPEVIQQLAKV